MRKEVISKMLDMRKGIYEGDHPNILLQNYETEVVVHKYKYNQDNNPLHYLNIYLPKGNNDIRPLLIDVHGGGWVYGDKDTNGLLCMDFVKRGFITMSMSYRLLPENKLVEMIQDIFQSLHHLYTLKEKYPIDFNNVSMMGDSAGGHLNLIVNAINNSAELQAYFGITKLPFEIKCIVANHPAPFIHSPIRDPKYNRVYKNICYERGYTKSPIYKYASIKKFGQFLNKNTEILIITSLYDSVVREQAFDCAKLLKKLNVPYDFYDELRETSWHVYNVTQPFRDISLDCNDYMEKFIRKHLTK